MDNHDVYSCGRDPYYESLLVQLQFSMGTGVWHGRVSGLLEYFTNGYSREEYVRTHINVYKGEPPEIYMVEISKIRTGFTKVQTEGEIIDVGASRDVKLKTGGTSQVADAILKDTSGTINLTLWDSQIKQVQKGSKVKIEGGYARDFKGKLSLNVGKYGKLQVVQY